MRLVGSRGMMAAALLVLGCEASPQASASDDSADTGEVETDSSAELAPLPSNADLNPFIHGRYILFRDCPSEDYVGLTFGLRPPAQFEIESVRVTSLELVDTIILEDLDVHGERVEEAPPHLAPDVEYGVDYVQWSVDIPVFGGHEICNSVPRTSESTFGLIVEFDIHGTSFVGESSAVLICSDQIPDGC